MVKSDSVNNNITSDNTFPRPRPLFNVSIFQMVYILSDDHKNDKSVIMLPEQYALRSASMLIDFSYAIWLLHCCPVWYVHAGNEGPRLNSFYLLTIRR